MDKAKLAAVVEMFVCKVCGEHARPVKRPVASNTRVPEFNADVGADIFHVDGVPFLHVVCLFTLYCQVEKLVNLQREYVRGKFVKVWQRYFGAPKKLKLDLGPEFDNKFIEQVRDTLGCEIIAVPGGRTGHMARQRTNMDYSVKWCRRCSRTTRDLTRQRQWARA